MPTLNLVKWLNPENPNAEKQKHKQINLSLKEDASQKIRTGGRHDGAGKTNNLITLKTETSSPITEIILSTSSFLITCKLNIIAYGTLIFTYLIDSLTS